jgi:hypothetical protein
VKQLLALAAVVALLAAAPSPAPSAAPRTLSVVCSRAPFFVFLSGTDRPVRAHTFAASLGQRFELVSGPRTTLEGFEYYETDVLVVDPGYPPGAHFWISRDCAIPSK